MSIICTPSSEKAATTAYVLPDISVMATPCASSSSVKPSVSSVIAATGTGAAGSVMSIICTPSSNTVVTTAYVLPDISVMATPCAPPSWVKPSVSSVIAATGTGAAGSVMSIICTPLSLSVVTTAYVLPDISAMATSAAPPRCVKPSVSSVIAATGTGAASAPSAATPRAARDAATTMTARAHGSRLNMTWLFLVEYKGNYSQFCRVCGAGTFLDGL